MNECNELLWFKCNIDVIFFPFFSVAFIFCKQTRASEQKNETEYDWVFNLTEKAMEKDRKEQKEEEEKKRGREKEIGSAPKKPLP